jgi:hypothetical protein
VERVKEIGAGVWRRYRQLPLWGQIGIGIIVVSVIVGPFVSDDDQEEERASSEQTTTSTEETTTTISRPTTTVSTTTTIQATTTTRQRTTTTSTTRPARADEFDDPRAQEIFEIERGICADYPPEEIAAEAAETPRSMSATDIAESNSKAYQQRFEEPALLGCLAGLEDQGYSGP